MFLDAETDAAEEGEDIACKIVFGVLFISLIMEEVAPVTIVLLLLTPVVVVVVINDCGKVICFPGEAGTKSNLI